ncbi:DsbA family protein [Kitasatospora sp. NPDC088346]|uniref:DsbA family protein n=1 Tax=Kitasatospora sp. NPDC088346 TaxID=3364073 RepID=UPI0038223253
MSHTSEQNPMTATRRMRERRTRAARAARIRRRAVFAAAAAAAAAAALAGGAVIALGGTGAGHAAAGAPGPLLVPAHASGPDGTVVTYGKADAPHTLEVYEDLRCPFCAQLETRTGKAMQEPADNGTYKIEYHLATFLDDRLGGSGSRTALAAAAAALNEGVDKFKQFHDVLYANQPDEHKDTFADVNYLLELAARVPGLTTDSFIKAVREGTYAPWAAKVATAFHRSGVTGTPTVKLDGRSLEAFGSSGAVTPERFAELVKQAVA